MGGLSLTTDPNLYESDVQMGVIFFEILLYGDKLLYEHNIYLLYGGNIYIHCQDKMHYMSGIESPSKHPDSIQQIPGNY